MANTAMLQAISKAVSKQFRVRVTYESGIEGVGERTVEGYLIHGTWTVFNGTLQTIIKKEDFHQYGAILELEGIVKIECKPGTLVLWQKEDDNGRRREQDVIEAGCPGCGAGVGAHCADGSSFDTEYGAAYQRRTCNVCGTSWTDSYKLTGQILIEPTKNSAAATIMESVRRSVTRVKVTLDDGTSEVGFVFPTYVTGKWLVRRSSLDNDQQWFEVAQDNICKIATTDSQGNLTGILY
jgi:hypothetical protein